MNEYSGVKRAIWHDRWFSSLTLEGQHLFLFLLTNASTNSIGLYELPISVMAVEAKIDVATVTQLLEDFEAAGKVFYDDGCVWVVKMRSHQTNNENSPKVQVHIQNSFDKMADGRIKELYAQHYGIDYRYRNGIDTVSIPNRKEKEKEKEKEKNQEICAFSAEKPQPPLKLKPDERIKEIQNRIAVEYAQPILNWKPHLASIKKMLEYYTPDEIVGCWIAKSKTGGNRFIPLTWVAGDIADFKLKRGPFSPNGNGAKREKIDLADPSRFRGGKGYVE